MIIDKLKHRAKSTEKVYDLALTALNKSELKDIILEHSFSKGNISFSVVQKPSDMKIVWQLRKKVFVEEIGYPLAASRSKLDRYGIHFLAKKDNVPIGTISVFLHSLSGLPIEKTYSLDLSKFKKDSETAEIEKLAVLHTYRAKTISLGLMVIAYEFIKLCNARYIFIFTLKNQKENINLYKRFGFKELSEFKIFHNKKAVSMILDIISDSVYERILAMSLRRVNFITQLAKMLSFELKR